MLYLEQRIRISWFLKLIVVFTVGLFSSAPLYAELFSNRSSILTSDVLSSVSIREVFCDEASCFFPGKMVGNKDIRVIGQIDWEKNQNLVLHTKGNVVFEKEGKIVSKKSGSVILKAGMEPGEKTRYESTVIFEGDATKIETLGSGKVKIYYNPIQGDEEHKYHNPSSYFYEQHVKTDNLSAYMLVNNVYDLQDMRLFLSGNYALSQDINADETRSWNEGKGFNPLKDKSKNMPFSGNFDGSGYSIDGLFINRYENDVGLFGMCGGRVILRNIIENLTLKNFDITGDHYVGSLAGFAANSNLLNIIVVNSTIKSRDVAGGLIGTTDRVQAESIQIIGDLKVDADENKGFVVGGAGESSVFLLFETEKERRDTLGKYKLLGNSDDRTSVCLKVKNDRVQPCVKCVEQLPNSEYKDGVFMKLTDDPTKILISFSNQKFLSTYLDYFSSIFGIHL